MNQWHAAQPLGWEGYGENEYTGIQGAEARPEVGVEEDAAEEGAEEAVDHRVAEPEVLRHTRRVRHILTGGGRVERVEMPRDDWDLGAKGNGSRKY